MTEQLTSDRFLRRLVWLTLGLKVLLAWLLPLTGDEAYFVTWGNNLSYGYYDHPGMTGWWIWLTLLIGQSPLVIRLPVIVGPVLLALLLRSLLRPIDRPGANLGAVLFLLSPLNLFNVVMTTDTPNLIFSLVSVWFVWRGERGGSKWNYLLGGLFLGAAFFSKYSAVLLGLSYAVYLLFRRRPRLFELGLVFVGVIPWAALNIFWLYQHCWTNVVFNIYNRNQDAGFSLEGVGIMAASLLFLLGPALVAFLLRPAAAVDRRPWAESIARLRETKLDLFAVCFALPLLMLLLVALGKTVGLHWLLAFCTCLFPVLVMLFRTGGLLRLVKWTGIYTLTLTGLVIILLLLPRQWASWHKSYDSIALGIWPDKILDQMREAAPGAHLASTSYAKAALLEFYAREHVMVVGPAQFHGRQDDLTTDFRLLDGQSIVIVTSRPRHVERFIPWFDQYRYSTIDVEGASFIVFVGDGFRYAVYRELVLRSVAEDFYALPAWLKRFSGACYFCDKYDLCGDRDN